MRSKIAAGNWKMNKTYSEGMELVEALKNGPQAGGDDWVILGTPAIHLKDAVTATQDMPRMKVAAQNCHYEASGAFTGELSVSMLQSIGVQCVILGHSERRQYFKETDEVIAKKVKAVIDGGLTPIFCCGEPLHIREEGWHVRFVKGQLEKGIFGLSAEDFSKLVIAYEPIWAIGTGVTASTEQAQEMHGELRKLIADKYGAEMADATSILYGGSVKPSNAAALFSQPDVDGGLVGGASLKAETFIPIIEAMNDQA